MGGRYKKYRSYQRHSTSFTEALPEGWCLKRLKHVSPEITVGVVVNPSTYFDDDGEIFFIRGVDVSWGRIETLKAKRISNESNRILAKSKLREGDIVSIRVGYPGVSAVITKELDGANCASLLIIRKPVEISSQLLFYQLSSAFGRNQVKLLQQGAAQEQINVSDIVNFAVACPPIDEAKTITSFLDHETAKIDTLIEKQKQLIELLKEKRQAVISHAVTKGLNPDAPMKDSGVEWLGEVPAHWAVRRLKHAATLQSGIPKGADLTGKLCISVPMLRVANVQDGYLDLEDVHLLDIEPDQLDRYLLKQGDVLMNEGGDNDKLGRGAVWSGEIQPCIHQNHVFAIRPENIESDWLDLLTRAAYAKFHFYRVAKQSTNLASISSSNIKETPMVIPPREERKEIIRYVGDQLHKLDKLEAACARQIELFQERRTALISAAVTGKIDVATSHGDTAN